MWTGAIVIVTGLLALQAQPPRPTLSPDLQRAQQHDRRGWSRLEARDFNGAAEAFVAAIQIHPDYADALYGLGRARMALQQYEQAVQALERCRDSYARAGTEDAEHRLLANIARENQLATLRRRLADLESPVTPGVRGPTPSTSTEVMDLKQQIRAVQADRDPGPVTGKPTPVPSFISLALGSAYFRVNRLPDAEHQFRDAIAVDPKFGEALSNLALVCVLTGRAQEAQAYVRAAEEARFAVNPELKRQIRDALAKSEVDGRR